MIDLMKVALIVATITFFLALYALDCVDAKIVNAVNENQIKRLGVVKFILTVIILVALAIILMNIGYLLWSGITNLFTK